MQLLRATEMAGISPPPGGVLYATNQGLTSGMTLRARQTTAASDPLLDGRASLNEAALVGQLAWGLLAVDAAR